MREKLRPILDEYRGQKENLIPVLQKVQGKLGYLPEEAISEISSSLGISRSEIYGVASFYAQFRFERQGEHNVKVCQGTACHVRGGKRIMEAVARELGLEPGQTTSDYKYTLERVACFGSCALAPVMVVDNVVHGRMTTTKARQILAETDQEKQN